MTGTDPALGFQTDPLWGRSTRVKASRTAGSAVSDGPLVGSKLADANGVRGHCARFRRTPCGVEARTASTNCRRSSRFRRTPCGVEATVRRCRRVSTRTVSDGPLVGSKRGVDAVGCCHHSSFRRTPCGVEADGRQRFTPAVDVFQTDPLWGRSDVDLLWAAAVGVEFQTDPLWGRSEMPITDEAIRFGRFQTDPLWGRSV